MSKIYLVGYHQSKFGKLYDKSLEQMMSEAAHGVLEPLGAKPDVVDTVGVAGCATAMLNDQMLLAGLVAQIPGLGSKMIDTAENACSSGGQAMLNVIYRLAAGAADVGMAIGVEKMRDDAGKMDGKLVGKVLGIASHPGQREGKVFVFPHIFAEIMAQYLEHHGATEEDLAHVPVTFYAHGNDNPFAQMKKVKVTVDDVMKIEGINRYIVDGLPLKTYECSQISDGYAAVLLCNERGLKKLEVPPDKVVEVAGFAQRTDPLDTSKRTDTLEPTGAYDCVRAAYQMAGITADNVSVAEVHDCFSVMGAMSPEILGKVKPGQGAKYYVEGRAKVGSQCPINTSGGLIAKGHPIGATGVAMPGWCYWQLTGQVPEALQVKDIDHAATFNIGGPICASVVFVLRRKQ
ncbi:MAG: thiolase family protein [Myxococcota bacterium]